MSEGRSYATVGMVYDFLVEMHQKTGRCYAFPEALEGLRQSGRLLTSLPQARTYRQDPTIEETTMFPPGKDVFCLLNMPYMVETLHTHTYFELTYVIKGSCTFLFEGESATLSAGDICIVSPGSGHSLPLEPGCLAISLAVRRSTFDRAFSSLLTKKDLMSLFFRSSLYETRRANYILLKTGSDPMTFQTMQQLVYECNLLDEFSNDCAANLLNLTLLRAIRAANNAITLRHYEGFSDRDFDFALVLRYIQENYRTVTLTSLAQAFHFSPTYLSKLIRKNMNQSFTEVLRTQKMNQALDYLMNTSLKISEISEAVGYDSVDHFTRTFRRVYGMPPLSYKKLHSRST